MKTDTLEMFPVLTLDMLKKAVKNAKKWRFTERLSKEQIESLPDGLLYPVSRVLPNNERAGVESATHVKLCVGVGDGRELSFHVPCEFLDEAYYINLKNEALRKLGYQVILKTATTPLVARRASKCSERSRQAKD
jgi:hypothetical protein